MTRKYCSDCACLVTGSNGNWECEECGKPVEDVSFCPEASKSCKNCVRAGLNPNGQFCCNNGDSKRYGKTIQSSDVCEDCELED